MVHGDEECGDVHARRYVTIVCCDIVLVILFRVERFHALVLIELLHGNVFDEGQTLVGQ